jgi:hypothetical protein
MSKHFLHNLNGTNSGSFRSFLNRCAAEPKIAWYPSAGYDFRPLLYLNPKYSELISTDELEMPFPDIFIFTDYFPAKFSDIINQGLLIDKANTKIWVEEVEELPRLSISLSTELVNKKGNGNNYGRVFFLKVKVKSDVLGEFTYPVIYAIAENLAFYCDKLIPQKAVLSHVIHVRYGGGCGGGGSASGTWVLNALNSLQCTWLISDGHHAWQSGDFKALELCKSLPKTFEFQLNSIRTIPGNKWSDHGDVDWYIVR